MQLIYIKKERLKNKRIQNFSSTDQKKKKKNPVTATTHTHLSNEYTFLLTV